MERKKKSNFPNRGLYLKTTATIYLGNIALGCGMNSYSPLVVEFARKYETKVDQVSYVFTILTIGYLLGALLTSFIYSYISRQFGAVLWVSGIACAMYISPHCPSLGSLYCVAGVLGISNGAYDASQVVWVMEMWQGACGPYIQAQHFFFAVGALIPGFLMAPFLRSTTESQADPTSSAQLWVPFTILGGYVTVAAVAQGVFLFFNPYRPPPTELRHVAVTESSLTASRLKFIVLSAIFLGFYQGMEMSTVQFISTFGQFGVYAMSESEGALLLTALAAAYTIGRGLGIVAIFKIPAQFILAFNLVTILTASAVLLASQSSVLLVWFGAALMGLGFSTTYPSFCAYIERHLVFTNAIGSIMLVCGSSVGSIYPVLFGSTIEHNSFVLIYVNLFTAAVVVGSFLVILRLTCRTRYNVLS